jgi:protein TonB
MSQLPAPRESSRQSVAFPTNVLPTKALPTQALPTNQPNPLPIPSEAAPENEIPPSRSGKTDPEETQRYLGVVRRILEKNKKYPESARRRGVQGKIVLVFSIAPDGSALNPGVEGEGPKELRDSGLGILAGRRFPPPPKGWNREARIAFPLLYSLH